METPIPVLIQKKGWTTLEDAELESVILYLRGCKGLNMPPEYRNLFPSHLLVGPSPQTRTVVHFGEWCFFRGLNEFSKKTSFWNGDICRPNGDISRPKGVFCRPAVFVEISDPDLSKKLIPIHTWNPMCAVCANNGDCWLPCVQSLKNVNLSWWAKKMKPPLLLPTFWDLADSA